MIKKEPSEKHIHQHAIVRGRVQGVGFRYTVKKWADVYGVVGNVRNLQDGSVEIYAQGLERNIDAFFQQLKNDPGAGRLDSISIQAQPFTPLYQNFQIKR